MNAAKRPAPGASPRSWLALSSLLLLSCGAETGRVELLQIATDEDLRRAQSVTSVGALIIEGSNLEAVSLPLQSADAIRVRDNPRLRTLELPALASSGSMASIESNPALVSLRLPALRRAERLQVENHPALSELFLPSLESVQSLIFKGNRALTSLELPSLVESGSAFVIEGALRRFRAPRATGEIVLSSPALADLDVKSPSPIAHLGFDNSARELWDEYGVRWSAAPARGDCPFPTPRALRAMGPEWIVRWGPVRIDSGCVIGVQWPFGTQARTVLVIYGPEGILGWLVNRADHNPYMPAFIQHVLLRRDGLFFVCYPENREAARGSPSEPFEPTGPGPIEWLSAEAAKRLDCPSLSNVPAVTLLGAPYPVSREPARRRDLRDRTAEPPFVAFTDGLTPPTPLLIDGHAIAACATEADCRWRPARDEIRLNAAVLSVEEDRIVVAHGCEVHILVGSGNGALTSHEVSSGLRTWCFLRPLNMEYGLWYPMTERRIGHVLEVFSGRARRARPTHDRTLDRDRDETAYSNFVDLDARTVISSIQMKLSQYDRNGALDIEIPHTPSGFLTDLEVPTFGTVHARLRIDPEGRLVVERAFQLRTGDPSSEVPLFNRQGAQVLPPSARLFGLEANDELVLYRWTQEVLRLDLTAFPANPVLRTTLKDLHVVDLSEAARKSLSALGPARPPCTMEKAPWCEFERYERVEFEGWPGLGVMERWGDFYW